MKERKSLQEALDEAKAVIKKSGAIIVETNAFLRAVEAELGDDFPRAPAFPKGFTREDYPLLADREGLEKWAEENPEPLDWVGPYGNVSAADINSVAFDVELPATIYCARHAVTFRPGYGCIRCLNG